MSHKLKVLTFPNDRLIGYLHLKEAEGLMEFHGRFKKDGDLLEGTCNAGWRMVGEAKGNVEVPQADKILLEVLPQEACDLSPLSLLNADDLSGIWLGNTYVNDEQLSYLARLTGLGFIDVQNNSDITDAGIAQLSKLRFLKVFVAHWTRISAVSLEYLSKMDRLTYVDIWGCEIPAEAVEEFKKALPKCTVRTSAA
ncbi:hypothetical protein IH992_25055 [Candidatus Poribacteria bacterium]|nr:hypothetical protein [Candidatus Poribacteria bacterium]